MFKLRGSPGEHRKARRYFKGSFGFRVWGFGLGFRVNWWLVRFL